MGDKSPQLGAWSSDRKALEEVHISGRGSDADAPELLRFGRTMVQLVARRESQASAEYDRPAAFVFLPRDWMENVPADARRMPLLHTGHYSLTGKIHFVNVAGNGRSLDYEGDAAELFDKLYEVGAQSFPTLVYSPKSGSSILSWYANGVIASDNIEVWSVAADSPTPERITEVLSRAYEGHLITPDQMGDNYKVWEDPTKGWAHNNAEKRVQHAIKLTLLGGFRHCSIREEQPGKDGRTDLEIVEDQDRPYNQIVHHAVLELKVLREKGSTGNSYTEVAINDHIRDGLEQAHKYGDGRSFNERMLCCFDMRGINKGADAVFAEIQQEAGKLGVLLRHWFLYRSSEHWRKCSVAQELKTA